MVLIFRMSDLTLGKIVWCCFCVLLFGVASVAVVGRLMLPVAEALC